MVVDLAVKERQRDSGAVIWRRSRAIGKKERRGKLLSNEGRMEEIGEREAERLGWFYIQGGIRPVLVMDTSRREQEFKITDFIKIKVTIIHINN